MKNSYHWVILIVVVGFLNSCSYLTKKKHTQNQFGSGATGGANAGRPDSQFIAPSSGPPPSVPTSPSQPDQVSPGGVTDQSGSPAGVVPGGGHTLPYGTPVPNRQGLVTSPYSPSAGLVDVRGYPPGQVVKCPFTGREFRVP